MADALRTITLGAAYTLGLDGEIGSIECGKRADFAVLEDDPSEIGGERLKDVRIWGTVQAGRVFPAAHDMTGAHAGHADQRLSRRRQDHAGQSRCCVRRDGLRLAVLVNDFGELPIDADLIEAREGNVDQHCRRLRLLQLWQRPDRRA